jgi:hypothetical protein
MSKECSICKNRTIFYVWSTSRNFPRRALINYTNVKTKHERHKVFEEGVPICFKCSNKLKEYAKTEDI